jgi:cytochrome c oxidase cbb3-type subunit III
MSNDPKSNVPKSNDPVSNDHNSELDRVTGISTTGHSWDGIKELNTPLPRWWLWTFYLTIIWAIGYWIVYPAWPLMTSHTTGLFGYSTRASVAQELAALEVRRGAQAKALETASLADIRTNPELSRIALARGKAAFGDNCAGCHGLGGAGSKGYPNLNDDDWIWGGKLDDIQKTLLHGIRWTGDDNTRLSVMSAFGRDGVLKRDEVRAVSNHVRVLAGLPTEQGAELAKGKDIYAQNCAACHGDAGKGNQELGAPNLADSIWLYGSDLDAIIESVQNGRAGVMPSWSGRLDPITIKSLTVYVHGLGGGQ